MSPKQMFFEIFTDRLDDTRNFFVDVIGFAVTRADEGFLVLQPPIEALSGHVGQWSRPGDTSYFHPGLP